MMNELYFSDNFFSAWKTDIYNDEKEIVGLLDLMSAFSSGCDIFNQDGAFVFKGRCRVLSTAWWISDENQKDVGNVKQRFAFFKKFYKYTRGSEVYSHSF